MKKCSVCNVVIGDKTIKGLCSRHWQLAAYAANPERRRSHSAKWRAANPEKARASYANYRRNNKERIKASAAKIDRQKRRLSSSLYYAKNADMLKAKSAAYRKANRDKALAATAAWKEKSMAAILAYREENKTALRASRKAWKQAHPEEVKAIDHLRRARKRGAEGKHTAQEVKNLFTLQMGCCAVCRSKLCGDHHKDHIQPLVAGGSNWISNIQLLCPDCNTSKNAKDPIAFMQSRGFLL